MALRDRNENINSGLKKSIRGSCFGRDYGTTEGKNLTQTLQPMIKNSLKIEMPKGIQKYKAVVSASGRLNKSSEKSIVFTRWLNYEWYWIC